MSLQLALALFNFVNALFSFFERQHWYQQGKAAADAEANAEQKRRIDEANAARADADDFADGRLHDPNDRG